MEQKEIDRLLEGVAKETKMSIDAVKTELTMSINNKNDVFAEKMAQMDKYGNSIDELTKAVETQGLELRKALTPQATEKGIDQIIAEKKEELSKLGKGERKTIEFTVSQEQVAKTTATRASVVGYTDTYRIPGVGQVATRGLTISPLFSQQTVGPNSNGIVRYTDQGTITRAAAEVTEGAAFPESAIAWTESTLSLQKIGDQIPVSYEAFNDVDFIAGEIQKLLTVNLALREDSQLVNGTGVSPQINGVYTAAATYSAPDLTLQAPNLYDLLLKMQETVVAGKESKYKANTVLVSYSDWNAMMITKNSQGFYLQPPWVNVAPGIMNVNGMNIIPSSLIASNTCLVGDFTWGVQFTLDPIIIEMGWVANQFINDLFTIKARKRTALLIKSIDASAFQKCTSISAAITLLT